MSVTLGSLVENLVESSPTGELSAIKQNLIELASSENRHSINDALSVVVENQGIIVSGNMVASGFNKDANSTKYWDFVRKQKFNVDLDARKAIDVESAQPDVEYPDYFDQLVSALEQYGEDHFPSDYAFSIIPKKDSSIQIVIIGEKLNPNNFYSGVWRSMYEVNSAGSISGTVHLDIHYYEEGNVRLDFGETAPTADLANVSASNILNYINQAENQATLKIMERFNLLNEKYFKNLRRLLPVTKSKINWGKAIGSYRLGSDVVNKK